MQQGTGEQWKDCFSNFEQHNNGNQRRVHGARQHRTHPDKRICARRGCRAGKCPVQEKPDDTAENRSRL